MKRTCHRCVMTICSPLFPVVGNILPVRIAGIKIVRQPWFFSAVFTVLSPFLPTKLVSRVEFLGGDLEALKKVSIFLYYTVLLRETPRIH